VAEDHRLGQVVDEARAAGGNGFGVPTSLEDWVELIDVTVGVSVASDREVADVASQAARRLQVAEATDRWRITGPNGTASRIGTCRATSWRCRAWPPWALLFTSGGTMKRPLTPRQVGLAHLALESQAY
jgi:hypothetical protein